MERSCRLTNTTYSDVSASLPLPSLPVSCGAADSSVRIADESSVAGADVVAHARPIAEFLDKCDVSYLDLKDASGVGECLDDSSWLYNEVLKYNSKAFDLSSRGFAKEKRHHNPTSEKKYIDENTIVCQTKLFQAGDFNDQLERDVYITRSTGLKKLKANKKKKDVSLSTDDVNHYQDIIRSFNNLVGDICGRVEVLDDDQEGENQSSLTLSDIRKLTNEILSIRTRKVLQLVPVDVLSRLLSVLDHQILCGQGLTIDDNSDAVVLISCALESICAALAIMTHQDIPKQLYKEEIIERILDFTKRQIMDMMAACDPCYRAIHRPKQNGCRFDGADDDDEEEDFGSGGNKRKRNFKTKKSSGSGNRVSSTVHNVIQKLCSILVNLKDLLRIVKLSDSCILQMAKMTFSTFLAENMELLQLKAIGLICGVYASYTQHRNFLVDETVQLLWKLPVSKRALRRYHLPDEEQKQIQMVSALLIQLVQCSADLPEVIKSKLSFNSFSDASLDATDPIKLQKSATETCCQFWRCVVERFTTSKPQDVSESKMIIENIVADLLTTLNLPEYPASALILEVLCVLLLENTGLKSKDMAARGATIDLLGTIAARLKCDNVSCNMNKFWITEEISENKDANSHPTDKCCICFREKSLTISSVICSVCQRYFHAECVGVAVDNLFRDWSCHVCTCKKQLLVLHSYCKPQIKTNIKNSMGTGDSTSVSRLEIVQQILLNYLQETSSDDDIQLFNRWFYLCLWYKDDPLSQDRAIYYFSRLKSKTILRDFGAALFLPREWAKKICLALGQNNSFSRGFDNILSLLLASLRENSPMLRTKALHAVSSIVEADPEVLCDKRVQCAVEGRFCDSSISVRQAALELVGRYIASHPDVGLKYFEKVAERIKDTGVSVRKRAIKIIRDMCMSNAGLNGFSDVTSAFIEIISRIGDEESSIQDGVLQCKLCENTSALLSAPPSTILVLDTNVVLHQIDLLENPAIEDVVVLEVVADEVKNKNLSVYNRLRTLCTNPQRRFYIFSNEYHRQTYVKAMVGESPNDRNDRAIRVATQWYQNHLGESSHVMLITNDRDNRRKAVEEGLHAETVESYVKTLGQSNLLDLVVLQSPEDATMMEIDYLRPSKRKIVYAEHKPMSEITSGLHRGIYHQGKLRVNRYNPIEAYVGSESIGEEIVVCGRSNMNRAFDGDIVAVEIVPQDQWNDASSLATVDDDEEEEDIHLVPGSVDDAPRNKITSGSVVSSSSCRQCGRVVGIIKRNWNSYCGSLEPMAMPSGFSGVVHALFVPKDCRLSKIRIQTRQLGNLLDKRIIVAVDSWDRSSRFPSGHYVRTIGKLVTQKRKARW